MNFLERLDCLLKENNLKKGVFLQSVGFDENAYSEWKKGTTRSYMKKIDIIADYFNVSVDYLLGRTDIRDYETYTLAASTPDGELTPEQAEELEQFRQFIINRDKNK